jgi:hypothetical protein
MSAAFAPFINVLESPAMLADELIGVHEKPRQVAPFSERYVPLTPAQGYEAALALHRHRLGQGWHGRVVVGALVSVAGLAHLAGRCRSFK